MNAKPTPVNYKNLKLSNISSDEYKHLKLLVFWPLFGILFMFVERFFEVDSYFPVHCRFDDIIPFCEWFLIPYLFWFVFLIGMHLYTLLFDTDSFKRMMKYIIFTYSVTIIIYILFPTCQELRPISFERDNFLTRFITGLYKFDTNTNVCPSIHVIGSMAVMEAALWSKTIKSKGVKIGFVIVAVLICLSTLFMKQHSVLDIIVALPICLAAHFAFFKNTAKSIKE